MPDRLEDACSLFVPSIVGTNKEHARWVTHGWRGTAGDQTSVAVADLEVLNDAERNFRSMILRELEKETVRYRGSRG